MAKAEKIAPHEDPELPKDTAATSDAQIADTNSVVVELPAPDGKIDQAVIDAGKELNDAATAATEMLAEEASKVKAVPAVARNPARVTASQRMRVARRQREYGRKLLERTTPGVSSVNRSVRLNNQTVRMMFERTWPYIDSCAYLLMRHGGFAVGDREATALLTALQTKVTAFRDEQEKNLQAVRAVGEAAADKEDSYAVEFTQALDIKVQVRSPIANLALEGFLKGDGVLTELETLMWNGERKLSDVEMETTQIRNQVRELGVFVVRTLNNLNSRYRARAEI